jgi:plastocyanin
MKARYLFVVVLTAALALTMVSCGSKESAPPASAPAASAPAATPIDMATVGSVGGGVTVDGTVAPPRKINMAAEPSCAAAHAGNPPVDQTIVVGDNKALANVIVYVKEGVGDRTFDTPKTPVVIDQKGCMYEPHVVAVRAGQSLEVRNDDKTTHNIHPTPMNNPDWNKSQAPGAPAIEETFARPEVSIPVKCNVHPWMKAWIAVFKHPYYAVTAKDGKFNLKDLPPGTYTIEAWHEKLGTTSQQVTIGAKETKSINFVFKAAPAGD